MRIFSLTNFRNILRQRKISPGCGQKAKNQIVIFQINLWHHTGSTIVAIRRDTEVIISPGPLAILAENDRIVIVGNQNVLQKVVTFIKEKPEM